MADTIAAADAARTQLRETLRATAVAFLDSYSAWDIEAILAIRAPDCKHKVLPASLKRPEQGQSNDEHRAYFANIQPLFKGFTGHVKDIAVDVDARAAVVWAYSTSESVIGPYSNEYMLWLKMTEDGTKLIEIREFVDSGYSTGFFGKLRSLSADAAPAAASS
ncbi:hypothetical protein HK405_003455 [Cladochytrium tenue]|nr:hypothetical protein HK405_003455 [Cladochytrium tenue]